MRHKIVISLLTISLLIITGIIGTWAAFETTEVYASNLQIEALSNGYASMSIDGVNYKEDLTSDDITKAIVAKYKGFTFDSDGRLIDSNGILQDLDDEDLREMFQEISLAPITSSGGEAFFYANSLGTQTRITVSSGMFAEFDIHFRSEVQEGFNLYFNTDEINTDLNEQTFSITSDDVLINSTENLSLQNGFSSFDPITGDLINYTGQESNITLKARDAVRFATKVDYDDAKIYEPYIGLGSYATDLNSENLTGRYKALASRYDSKKNASFTYTEQYGMLYQPMKYENVPTTYQDMLDLEALTITDFGAYHQTKTINFKFWIEGYDADCFQPIVGSNIQVSLSFRGSDTLDTYQINYHTNTLYDEDEVITKTYIDSPIKIGNDPILLRKGDYILAGWYAEASCQNEFNFEEVILTDNRIRDAYPMWNYYYEYN